MDDDRATGTGRSSRSTPACSGARLREAARVRWPGRIGRPRAAAPRARPHRVLAAADRRLLRGADRAHHAARSRLLVTRSSAACIEEQRRGERRGPVPRPPAARTTSGSSATRRCSTSGLLGLRRVKGYDLERAGRACLPRGGRGARAARRGSPAARVLPAEPLLMLPLEDEVGVPAAVRRAVPALRRHPAHEARGRHAAARAGADRGSPRVPLMAAAAEALAAETPRAGDPTVPAARRVPSAAARGDADPRPLVARTSCCPPTSAWCCSRRSTSTGCARRSTRPSSTRPRRSRRCATSSACSPPGRATSRKPPAYFLVGPTGVGKNHLVESLVPAARGRLGRRDPDADDRGAELHLPVGHQRAARRDARVHPLGRGRPAHRVPRASRRSAPFAIILVDEVEKAHPQLRTFFLSILDRGTTTDNRGAC